MSCVPGSRLATAGAGQREPAIRRSSSPFRRLRSLPARPASPTRRRSSPTIPPSRSAQTLTNTPTMTWTSIDGVRRGRARRLGRRQRLQSTRLSETVTVSGPDLQITKDDGGATSFAGGVIAYTLAYQNVGNTDATGRDIRTPSRPTRRSTPAASTPGGSCAAGQQRRQPVHPHRRRPSAPGASGSVDFAVTVDDPLAAGVSRSPTRPSITDDGTNGPEPTPADNTDSDITPVTAVPDLSDDQGRRAHDRRRGRDARLRPDATPTRRAGRHRRRADRHGARRHDVPARIEHAGLELHAGQQRRQRLHLRRGRSSPSSSGGSVSFAVAGRRSAGDPGHADRQHGHHRRRRDERAGCQPGRQQRRRHRQPAGVGRFHQDADSNQSVAHRRDWTPPSGRS